MSTTTYAQTMTSSTVRDAAGSRPTGDAGDSETSRLQNEYERVRRQRLALEKQQNRARTGLEMDGTDDTNDPESDAEHAALVALQPPSTDPFACCCRPFKFKKLGQSYILHERRVVQRGRVSTELILVGPHWIGVVVTISIIVGSTGLFLHQQCTLLPWYYTLITLGFCGLTLYYLYCVAGKDPGIVFPPSTKKAKQDDQLPGREDATTLVVEDDDEEDRGAEVEDLEAGGARARAGRTAPPTGNFVPPPSYTSRFSPRARYCDICEISQDAYTEHCDDCGVCIEDYDHHCPWMGKCIGKKNMYAFKMFNVTWVFYVIFVLFVSIQNVDWGDAAVQRLHRLSTGEWVPMGKTEGPH